MALRDDPILTGALALIPPGWENRIEGDRLIIERAEPAWIFLENKINAPFLRETPEERAARIKTYGKLMKPRLVYGFDIIRLESGDLVSTRLRFIPVEVFGLDDDMHSVEPLEVSSEVWELRKSFEEALALVVTSLEELAAAEGRLVAARVSRSGEVAQGRMASPRSLRYSDYVQLGGETTLLYTKEPLAGRGPWTVLGRAVILEAEPYDPGRKETVREVHLAAEIIWE